MRKLLAGVAAVAMAFGAAHAQPGNGQGKGNDKAQSAQKGGGQGNAHKSANSAEKRGGPTQDRGLKVERVNVDRGPDNRGNGKVDKGANFDRGPDRRGNGNGKATNAYHDDRDHRDYDDYHRDRDDRDAPFVDRIARLPYRGDYGMVDGCPPGLAKKNPPCVPPGLAKKDGYQRDSYYRPAFFGIGGIGDGRFYYDDGYLYRLGGNDLISGFIPLLGGALGIGNVWPSYYQPARLDPYYVDYYSLSPRGYRYADNVLYRVDPETAAIQSVAALLTGDEFRIGQPMPIGYDVYNVPYGYRDRYYDRPDAYYRYADGYIYEVDPETRLIAAAIEMLI